MIREIGFGFDLGLHPLLVSYSSKSACGVPGVCLFSRPEWSTLSADTAEMRDRVRMCPWVLMLSFW